MGLTVPSAAMVVGSLRLTLRLHGVASLKAKRSPRQKIVQRVRNRFKVAAGEVDTQDVWNLLTLGFSAVGPSEAAVDRVLHDVADFVEELAEGELIDEEFFIERH